MTDHRKRSTTGTVQRRAFVLLQSASLNAEAIGEAIGCDRETARNACHYLRDRGLVTLHGTHRRRFYVAVPGKRAPEDRRGKPRACRNHRGEHAYAKWLRIMAVRHGSAWRPPARGIELERAWARS